MCIPISNIFGQTLTKIEKSTKHLQRQEDSVHFDTASKVQCLHQGNLPPNYFLVVNILQNISYRL